MSLLTRLRATEAQKIQDAAGAQAGETSENLDPRTKMMRDIQAMFDGYATCSVDGSGAPADDGQNTLSLKLKRKVGRPCWKATTLDEAAAAFREQLKNTTGELDALWGDWSRSWNELTASARALSSSSLDGADECGNMSEEFERFIQEQLETFRQTCEEDFEKMELIEQGFKERLQSQVSKYLKCVVVDL